MTARDRGERDFADGIPVVKCPFATGKDRRAWIAAWHLARTEAERR